MSSCCLIIQKLVYQVWTRHFWFLIVILINFLITLQIAMITDTVLTRMPLRRRDRSRVIDPARTEAKTFGINGDTVYVRR